MILLRMMVYSYNLDVEQMLKNGNKKVNEKYSVGPCPMPSDSSIMSDYIWAKYGMTVLKISNRVLEKQLVATEYNHMMNGLKEGGLILKKDPKGPKLPEDSIEKVIPVESRVDEKKLQTLYDMVYLN